MVLFNLVWIICAMFDLLDESPCLKLPWVPSSKKANQLGKLLFELAMVWGNECHVLDMLLYDLVLSCLNLVWICVLQGSRHTYAGISLIHECSQVSLLRLWWKTSNVHNICWKIKAMPQCSHIYHKIYLLAQLHFKFSPNNTITMYKSKPKTKTVGKS